MRGDLSENAEISAGNLENSFSRDEVRIRQASNLLRGGLAFIWFWEGLVPKFLFIASRDVSLVAKIGLGEFAVSAIHLIGAVEILMAGARHRHTHRVRHPGVAPRLLPGGAGRH